MTQQTQNICIPFIQRRPNVFDAGPTLYKCYTNVLCLLGTDDIIENMKYINEIYSFALICFPVS